MRKKYLLFLLLTFIFLIKSVYAGPIIGVSPGNLDFKNVLRGGYAEKFITITISSEEAVNIELQARGDIASWLDFSENLSVSKDKPARITVSVSPPADMPNGIYNGFISAYIDPLNEGNSEGHATGVVRAVLDVVVSIEITDIETVQCSVKGFRINSVEKGDDLKLELDILNEGNVRLKPLISTDVWDQEQLSIVKSSEYKSKEILPTKEETISFDMPSNGLEIGQYWADIKVEDCYASQLLTFDVLEEGALKADGVLLGIFVTPFAVETGQTMPIDIEFKNTGQKEVNAYFKGQITKEGKVVQVLESEKINAPIDEVTPFKFYFTPKEEGKYLVSGRVFYEKKRTFESSAIINVISKKFFFGLNKIIMGILYVIIFSVILFLFFKIRREKRRYLEKLKDLRQ